MPDYGPRTDAEESADNARREARQRGDARCDLQALAEKVGACLRGIRLSDHAIACVSEQLCEQLISDPNFSPALDANADPSGYAIAERAMIRAANRGES